MHGRNIAHRDIKPENVLYTGSHEAGTIKCKLADFGTATSVMHDTPAWVPHATKRTRTHYRRIMPNNCKLIKTRAGHARIH